MNENNKTIIAQLEQVDQLLSENSNLEYYIEHGAAQETLAEISNIRAIRGDNPQAPSVYATMPVFPLEKKTYASLEKDVEFKKRLFFGTLGVTALVLIIYFLSHVEFFNTVSVIGIFASAVLGYLYSGTKKTYAQKKKAYDDSVKTYEQTLGIFRDGLKRLEEEKKTALEALEQYKLTNAVCFDKYMAQLEKFGENRENAKQKLDANLEEIHKINVVDENYFRFVRPVLSMLKSGRADSYKEALNLAIQEERQEQEAAERRAAEARRQAEEERRTAIMERRAAEERRHNEQMERQQAEHDRAMQRQARDAQRQADKQAFDAKVRADKEHSQQLAVARQKCASCANSRNCHVNKNSLAGLTCGGYRPR